MAQPAADEATRWWTKVLVGQTNDPHPEYGDAVSVKLRGGVLHLSGELDSVRARNALVNEARRYVGRGLDDVDARHLVVTRRDEVRGVLEQTVIAAFANTELADYALSFLREQSRLPLKEAARVRNAHDALLDRIGEFAADVRAGLAAGSGVIVVRVDETDAFDARELLDEDTRSLWTLVTPPVPVKPAT
jgi:hypothetical protein